MGNCLGKDSYPTFDYRGNTILSLRDQNNKSHCVLTFKHNSNNQTVVVQQIVSRFNQTPYPKYHHAITALFNHWHATGTPVDSVDDVIDHGYAYVERQNTRLIVSWNDVASYDVLLGDYYFVDHAFPQNLPEHLTFSGELAIRNRSEKIVLPNHLTFNNLVELEKFDQLHSLPDHLTTNHSFSIEECKALVELPKTMCVRGVFNVVQCVELRAIHCQTENITLFAVVECPLFKTLPHNLVVDGNLYLIKTAIIEINNNVTPVLINKGNVIHGHK